MELKDKLDMKELELKLIVKTAKLKECRSVLKVRDNQIAVLVALLDDIENICKE